MKIIVNPAYEHLRKFVESIPDIFESEGRVIYSGRNLIKVMTVDDGLEINIKRYGVPALVNRIAYSFFRAPKGRRAFSYPNILLQRGFETPVPIAYIEECKWGLIKYSYFISLQSSYRRNFYEFGNADVNDCRDVVIAFARYTARLHESDIMHRDYSPGNILFDKIDGEYHFMLVDINRMSFGKISIDMAVPILPVYGDRKPFLNYLPENMHVHAILMNNTALIKCLHTGRSSGFILQRNIK